MTKLNNMRAPRLAFRGQSLDNESPDPVRQNNETIPDTDREARQDIARRISDVARYGKRRSLQSRTCHATGPAALLFHFKDEFAFTIPAEQRDRIGRVSPIVCYGHFGDDHAKDWPRHVVCQLRVYAGSIDRTILPDQCVEVYRQVTKIGRRRRRAHMLRRCMLTLQRSYKSLRRRREHG